MSGKTKELTTIYNKNKHSRRIKRLVYKARSNKSQIVAFVIWAALSALCFTVFIYAGTALKSLSAEMSGGSKAAIAAETCAPETSAPETRTPETCDGRCKRRPLREGEGIHGRRPRAETSRETSASGASFNNSFDPTTEAAVAITQIKEKKPVRGAETNHPETLAPETTAPDNSDVSREPHNWYCRNNDTHARPVLPSEFNFIKSNNGYWMGSEGCGKVIYLTFDAGYENGNVAKILDTLCSKKVSGAFFLLDNFVRRNPELVKRMADEGHLVCNHTAHHKDMTKLTDDEFKNELVSLDSAARELAGVELAKFYRPPCGAFSERDLALASQLGYKTVMWSYAYADWDNNAQMVPDKALGKLLAHTHEGMFLLLHPTSSTNAEILDDFIDRMTADGWRFGRLDELSEG